MSRTVRKGNAASCSRLLERPPLQDRTVRATRFSKVVYMKAEIPLHTTGDPPLLPNVIESERLCGGLLITFESGEIAFYSADLLHRNLASADVYDCMEAFDPLA